MLDELVLNPATRGQLTNFAARPAHAVLLFGPAGIGKTAVARALAMRALNLGLQEFARHPYARIISPDERGTIPIDAIRGLRRFLQLKTTGRASLRRAVIVEHAEAMPTEAQNAFLKLLEEPPADTLIILTTANVRALLPTIRSRLQSINLREPDEADIKNYFFKQGRDEQAINQAFLLSNGLPGLMSALLEGDKEHPLMADIIQAKKILAGTVFERLASADALSKQKDSANALLDALLCIALAGQAQAAAQNDARKLKQWHRVRKETLGAKAALRANASAKLVLTNLMLHI